MNAKAKPKELSVHVYDQIIRPEAFQLNHTSKDVNLDYYYYYSSPIKIKTKTKALSFMTDNEDVVIKDIMLQLVFY